MNTSVGFVYTGFIIMFLFETGTGGSMGWKGHRRSHLGLDKVARIRFRDCGMFTKKRRGEKQTVKCMEL